MLVLIAGPSKPPRFAQGLGLPYLAAVLESAGFATRIMDLYPDSPETDDPAILDQRLAEAVAQEQPRIVGVTIHTPAYAARIRLARLLRERLPGAWLVAGGHHPTAEPVDLLQHSDFDVCVLGEGEETLLDIAKHIAQGRDIGNIPGLVYKRAGAIVRTPPRPPIANLDALPFPAHHLLGLEHYNPHPILGIRSQAILTYRGCPMRCAYCCNPQGNRVRRRNPSQVTAEMKRVVDEFGVRGFNFYDNLFGLNRRHALAVCEEILRHALDVQWDCWTSGNLIDAELAAQMRAAGCIHVGFGAEGGDDRVLARARRGFTVAQHQQGISTLRAAGIKVEPFFMIGLPGESEESIRQTVEFAKRCGADTACLSLHRPYPGTAIWQNPEAFGVRIVRGPDFEAYIETEQLSRSALLEWALWAGDQLKQAGLMEDFLRYDHYAWE